MKKTLILIADDEEDVLKMLGKRLKIEGYSVIAATNGEDAISFSKIATP